MGKANSNNPMQNGTRRQRIKKNQNNVGNPQKSSGYDSID